MNVKFLLLFITLIGAIHCGQQDGEDYFYKPAKQSSVKPIVVFHGLDSACIGDSRIMNLVDQLGEELSTYVRCVEYARHLKTWTENILVQSKNACNLVNSHPEFQEGFSVVGSSAGGVVSRYLAEACDTKGTLEYFVTLGGPHMGVTEIPYCHSGILCDIGNWAADEIAYWNIVQELLGPAGYYRDVERYQEYIEHSILLAGLNNETTIKNEAYKQRIISLKKMTLIMFLQDEVVYPKESEWFGTFGLDNKTVIPLEETELYKQDWLGLKIMEESGRLVKASINAKHVHWTPENITKLVVPNLKDQVRLVREYPKTMGERLRSFPSILQLVQFV